MVRRLIVNADDFGSSRGINCGIVEAHERGIVTSTSLMVGRPAAGEAASLAAAHPEMSVGLHFEAPSGTGFDRSDPVSVGREFGHQLERFRELLGREPSHVDSHHHVHSEPGSLEIFLALVEPLGVPLRRASEVSFIGGFYAQWEWRITDLRHVSVEALQEILHREVLAEWTEVACHPGYVSEDSNSIYLAEREAELFTLTDPRIRSTIRELGLELCSYADYAVAERGDPAHER